MFEAELLQKGHKRFGLRFRVLKGGSELRFFNFRFPLHAAVEDNDAVAHEV